MKKQLCVKLVIYKNYTEMYGQQNIKFNNVLFASTNLMHVKILTLHLKNLAAESDTEISLSQKEL